ncbi:putative transcription factor HSF-type-DNA-binding family [Medicago truncatula]|uniref:Putative transcription factor HSF-type-DNA-binding family n=1 Tax=Medicago truncatula TaxID=3880 RepID=A0A396JDR6_MEDTR|nr:putative transcription factor HSF-type-DNA-binding family [Medicago truncatula]
MTQNLHRRRSFQLQNNNISLVIPIRSNNTSFRQHQFFCFKGFRKKDSERWEFANEEFIKDQKHLLKNIHRRKPIHSHSHPPGSAVDPERAAFEKEIEKLSQEKNYLESSVLNYKHHQSTAKFQLDNFQQLLDGMEIRQTRVLNYFEKALQNPTFVDRLKRKIESMDAAACNKKRRLPHVDHVQPVAAGSLIDNHSNFSLGFENVFHQNFLNKLRLELSPSVSDMNLVSGSTHVSTENEESLQKNLSEGELTEMQTRTDVAFAPETLELADPGASFAFNMDSCLSRRATTTKSPNLQSLEPSSKEGDSYISRQLNLTLASCTLEFNRNSYSARSPQIDCQKIGNMAESRVNASGKESEIGVYSKRNLANKVLNLASPQEVSGSIQVKPAAPKRVNDLFWEQFLTE